jgi:thiamine-phosphate pyrophosphorylase
MPDDAPISADLARILDAAANRASEGLRVIEDYARFALDDAHLTRLCKELRHDLAAALGELNWAQRLAARQTRVDVGTSIAAPREYQRVDLHDVLSANFARLEESLRSLEEFLKIERPALASRIEQLRYRTYTLHRAVGITQDSLERLKEAKLYVLIDGRNSLSDFREFAMTLVNAGVHVLQLREKRLDDRMLLERARSLREITRGTSTLFIMNDRPDLAVLSLADGVHLGQDDLCVHEARKIAGPQMLIGVSTHNLQQARQAVIDGANYIGVGPTFPSGTKQFEQFAGLDFIRAVAAEIRLPAFAIGGITLDNVSQVMEAGVSRIAVSGAITGCDEPGPIAQRFMEILKRDDGEHIAAIQAGIEETEADRFRPFDEIDAELRTKYGFPPRT